MGNKSIFCSMLSPFPPPNIFQHKTGAEIISVTAGGGHSSCRTGTQGQRTKLLRGTREFWGFGKGQMTLLYPSEEIGPFNSWWGGTVKSSERKDISNMSVVFRKEVFCKLQEALKVIQGMYVLLFSIGWQSPKRLIFDDWVKLCQSKVFKPNPWFLYFSSLTLMTLMFLFCLVSLLFAYCVCFLRVSVLNTSVA